MDIEEASAESVSLRTLLVGTARSIKQLHHTLAVADPAPCIVGALLPAGTAQAADLPCAGLGSIESLAEVIGGGGVDQVLVSLPLAMSPTVQAVAGVLDRAGVTWRFMPTLGDQLAGRTTSRITGGLPGNGAGGGTAGLAGGPIDPMRLIERTPRPLHEQTIRACVTGKCVLITGDAAPADSRN